MKIEGWGINPLKQKSPAYSGAQLFGGEGGIRTLDTLRYTHFPGVLLRPLGHLSKLLSHSCLGRKSAQDYTRWPPGATV